MNQKIVGVAVACLFIQGCFFFVIPGSVTGKVSDAITGAKGANCVSAENKVGDKIRGPDGSIGTIKSLSGTSSRCTDSRYPTRAEIVFAADTITPAAPPSVYVSPLKFDLPTPWESQPLTANLSNAGWYTKFANKNIDVEVMLSATAHAGITDLSAYAATRRAALIGAITDAESSDIVPVEINGRHAYRYVVTGKTTAGQKATYVGSVIEGPRDIAVMLAYTFSANYETQKDAIAEISEHVVGFHTY